ncbi:MAG: hypothetical protein ACI9DF_004535 [Verrucomicrobiales bacterium]|jgi:hypothetical protein
MAARPSHSQSLLIRTLSISTVALVILLGAGAFAVSFHALQSLAQTNGFDGNSFILPLILDGGIIVFSLSALRFELSGVSSRYPMSLVIVTTVASILFNIVHAESTLIARSLSAMPPLILFLSFELLMKQVRLEAGMIVAPKSTTKQRPENSKSVPTAPRVDERRQRVENLRSQNLGPRQIAQRLGVSVQTVYRDLGQLKKAEA